MKLKSCLFLFVILISGLQCHEQNIVFYKYQTTNESIDIGKVSNLGHNVRRYSFKKPQSNLALDESTGVLRTVCNVERTMNFDVLIYLSDDKVIETKVNLELKIISVKLIKNSGSFQIHGLTPEAFIDGSREESLIISVGKYLTQKITNSSCNIVNLQNFSFNIFSIVQNQKNATLLDVRFFATSEHHNLKTIYYHHHQIHWIMLQNQEIIEKLFRIKITTVNIDECLIEGSPCELSCFNNLTYINQSLAISKSYLTFQGIEIHTKPVCETQDFGYFNDIRDKTKVISLNNVCPIYYPPINPSESFTMSLNVYPNETNGVVLYFGQKYVQRFPDVEDSLLLKVVSGHPTLVLDAGSGEKVISSKCMLTLHQRNVILIVFDRRKIEMIVLNSNSSTCINSAILDGKSKVLNINTPIQIGAANLDIFKKSQSNVLNAKFSHFYISKFNREDNINQITPEESTYKTSLLCFIGILIMFVIGLLLIICKYKNITNKFSATNLKESLVVSYDNSKKVTSLKTVTKDQQNGNLNFIIHSYCFI